MQKEFAERTAAVVQRYPEVLGLAAGGSFITGELDQFSDLDLLLITSEKIAGNKQRMVEYASAFGELVSAFTGEHVGESRLLICLYQAPLLHVDIKFLVPDEFQKRVEDPVILFERDKILSQIISKFPSRWPAPDMQWMEDRFWTWIHYAALKIGRGELLEAFDFLSFLRMTVLSPLLQVKNKRTPRGVRKVEKELSKSDMENLKITIATYNASAIIRALENSISIYRGLRRKLFTDDIILREAAEKLSTGYLKEIRKGALKEV